MLAAVLTPGWEGFVTVGTSGAAAGFDRGNAFGSLAPDRVFKGNTTEPAVSIERFNSNDVADFVVYITNARNQTLFTRVHVIDGNGTLRTFNSADATFTNPFGGNHSQWLFGSGSNRVWATTDAAEVRLVRMF